MKIIDMHCDTIYEILEAKKRGETMRLLDGELMVNLNKMKSSGYLLQNFALYLEQEQGVSSFAKVQRLLEVFQEQMKQHADTISQVTTASEMLDNERAGKLSALLALEGGEACEGSVEKLHYFYEQGVRMMTLTWNFPNEIGYPNFRSEELWNVPDTQNGLTKFGIQLVEEMEHLGMIVDVSHLSDAGFYDVLKYTNKPFVASHSNARSVCAHVRNLTDDMICKIAERGGVIGLNYHSRFLADEYNMSRKKIEDSQDVMVSDGRQGAMISDGQPEGIQNDEISKTVFMQLARHVRHIVNIGGIECLGLGSDFDGIPAYRGMPRMDTMEKLADVLQECGFHESEIDQIFYKNVLQLYKEVLS